MPERVPGVRAGRRARLRLGLSGPDRSDPDAAAAGHRGGAIAAIRLLAVRRVRRRLPGQDRDPAPPDPPAGPRGGRPAPPRPREAHHEGPLPHLLDTGALRASTEARPDGRPAARARPEHDLPGAGPAGRLDDVARPPGPGTGDLPRVVAPHRAAPSEPAAGANHVALDRAYRGQGRHGRRRSGRGERRAGDARADILHRIRAALRDATPSDVPRNYRTEDARERDEIVDLFAERVAEYRATVHRVGGGRGRGGGRADREGGGRGADRNPRGFP